MATYKIDASHSEVTFKVRHLMITNVTGHFTKFDGEIKAEKKDLSDATATFEADVESITTNDARRDAHLKGDEFFSAEKFPKLSFKSTSLEKKDGTEYKLTGDLTLHGVTKAITLNVTYGGEIVDPWGQHKIGFEVEGKISRKDFGLNWNGVTETGGIVVSDEVRLLLNVQYVKQQEAVTA